MKYAIFLAVVMPTTLSVAQQNYQHCSRILSYGMREGFRHESSGNINDRFINNYCRSRREGGRRTTHGSAEFTIKNVPFKFGYGSSKERYIASHICQYTDSSHSSTNAEYTMRKQVNSSIIEAWKECIALAESRLMDIKLDISDDDIIVNMEVPNGVTLESDGYGVENLRCSGNWPKERAQIKGNASLLCKRLRAPNDNEDVIMSQSKLYIKLRNNGYKRFAIPAIKKTKSIKHHFERIQAGIDNSGGKQTRSVDSWCPPNFELIHWGLSKHHVNSGSDHHYCECHILDRRSDGRTGIVALTSTSRPSSYGGCHCFGLCIKSN